MSKERDYLEDLDIDGMDRITIVCKEIGLEGMDWINLARGWDK
jgi:hypothetical protein